MAMDSKENNRENTPHQPSNTRKTVRRKKADRRSEVRFEPDKENRRQNKGRRSSDIDYLGA